MEENRNVNLTIDSRIISHLGEALIDDEKVALLELIKNSSDADALNCSIVIDTLFESDYGKGMLVIEDDGNGMNPYIIENAFLKIATSFKNNNQKISPKFGRLAQGNKGIGRLALNQLGEYLIVKTKLDQKVIVENIDETELDSCYGNCNREELIADNEDIYYSFAIDWNKYENYVGRIEDIPIQLNNERFNSEVFTHTKDHGTRIEVLGLKGLDFWKNGKTINELETDVLAFLNPYIDEKANFKVKIKLDNQIFRSNIYDKEYISRSCDSIFSFDFNEDTNNLFLETRRSRNYVKRQVDDLIVNLEKYDCELESEQINYENYYEKFGHVKKCINLTTIESIYFDSPKSKMEDAYLYDSIDVKKPYLPGNFSGTFYGYDFAPQAVNLDTKKMIQNIIGVKLYRNNFRIFPYGNVDNDWLGMSSFNQRVKSVVYKTHTTTGFINIDGEKNLELLKELTNRQGLVLDNHGKNFILIMRELVFKHAAYEDQIFSDSFSFVRKVISDLEGEDSIVIADLTFRKRKNYRESANNKVQQIEVDLKKIESEVDSPNLFKDQEINSVSKGLQTALSGLKADIDNIDKEYKNKDKQIKEEHRYFNELLPVIGATIISETLAHEIIRLSQNIKSYSSRIRTAIPKDDKQTMIKNLGNIDSDIKFLARYATLLDVNSYSKRRKFEVVSLKNTIESILEESPLLSYKNISIKYEMLGTDFSTRIIKDSLKIIIENFVINSTYWLERMKIPSPKLYFELNKNMGSLIIYDNGIGIDMVIEEKLFEPFTTNKPVGDGRGMGLNIVKGLLNEIGATIVLSSDTNEQGNRYKFIIVFAEDVE